MGNNNNKNYFEDIVHKIDIAEHPERYQEAQIIDEQGYGEVDATPTQIIKVGAQSDYQEPPGINLQEIEDTLPKIDSDRIDGVIALYKELNQKYGLNFDTNKITNIGETFKSIVDPVKKEIFEVYLREYLDRLRLVCINQLGNTVYSLIQKLTNEETLRALTISERVALLDRLFEYMDKVNNMATFIPRGDTSSELKEIAERAGSESDSVGSDNKTRNREIENYVLNLLSGKC